VSLTIKDLLASTALDLPAIAGLRGGAAVRELGPPISILGGGFLVGAFPGPVYGPVFELLPPAPPTYA
jgi:hypothetical protein